MQVSKEQLKRQQMILKALRFYLGKIDGVWGPLSITAKKKFESSPTFIPGLPNNGLPFKDGVTYPAGMVLQKDGLLYHPAIDELLAAPVTSSAEIPPKQTAVIHDAPDPVPEAPKLTPGPAVPLADKSGSHKK